MSVQRSLVCDRMQRHTIKHPDRDGTIFLRTCNSHVNDELNTFLDVNNGRVRLRKHPQQTINWGQDQKLLQQRQALFV